MKWILTIFNYPANRYYRMDQQELETEASKWRVGGYGLSDGTIDRQIVIDALLKKDTANLSVISIVISLLGLIFSVIALYVFNK